MNEIENIASKHLGRASDGTVVQPYVTPDAIDPSLLVAIPRSLNRTIYGIDDNDLKFRGFDIWNCYEVSALLHCGMPVSCVLKLWYPADSPTIVESKSLKLYLNSFNMHKLNTNSIERAWREIEDIVSKDLEACLNTHVSCNVVNTQKDVEDTTLGMLMNTLEYSVELDSMVFDEYNESADILQPEHGQTILKVMSSLLRSNCRVTNQPDWGDVYIFMQGESVPTYESLLKYIVSMRRENHFHEEICECIYTRLYEKFKPDQLGVACMYTRRGGIDINPVRASSDDTLNLFIPMFGDYALKTLRQ